ncbi:MAG: L,D-transpeptidase [Candidatus Eisenbacteria bacterium]
MLLPLLLALAVIQPAPAPAAPSGATDARIVVVKSRRELRLVSRGEVVRTYHVALGLEPVAPKARQGDFATPEGNYYVCSKNPHSRYDLALGISYPGPNDAMRGLEAGLITPAEHDRILSAFVRRAAPPSNTRLGGQIMIHGRGAAWDWTEGCIALNNLDIEELFNSVPVGTPVEILP